MVHGRRIWHFATRIAESGARFDVARDAVEPVEVAGGWAVTVVAEWRVLVGDTGGDDLTAEVAALGDDVVDGGAAIAVDGTA